VTVVQPFHKFQKHLISRF